MNVKRMKTLLLVCVACLVAIAQGTGCPSGTQPETGTGTATAPPAGDDIGGDRTKFKVAWSIYVGWMPWNYAQESGILEKWADAYGIEIELIRLDYIASVEAYVAKQVDACVMTNMECLDMPAASGIDSTVLIMGDYSDGNDAILTRNGVGIKDLPGKTINLVELSVSHYLLARALEMNGLREEAVTLQNTSDSDIAPIFLADRKQEAVVTWNPMVMEIEQTAGIDKIFSSADIPGEILDLMIVRTDVLQDYPQLGKALTGAWFEVMEIMSRKDGAGEAALQSMAEAAGSSTVEYKNQLKTTAMFYTPQAALDYMESADVKRSMDFVRGFCFKHGLLGEDVRTMDAVGISYPDGSMQGSEQNVKMRFNSKYTKMAVAGELSTH